MILSKYLDSFDSTVVSPLKPYLPESLCRPVPLVLATTVGALSVYLIWKKCTSPSMPPTPRGWPILGNMLDISEDNMHLDLIRLQERDKLPDIFSFNIGPSYKSIVLNSHDVMKDCFCNHSEHFSARPQPVSFTNIECKDEIVMKDYSDPTWKEGKSFIASSLRSAGFGSTKASEEKILAQIDVLMDVLNREKDKGEGVDFTDHLTRTTANVIFGILFNNIYDHEDPELNKRIKLVREWFAMLVSSFIIEIMPYWFVRLFMRGTMKEFAEKTKEMRDQWKEQIMAHHAVADGDNPRDFVDIYLTKKKTPVDLDVLTDTVMFFIPDAIDTIASFVNWIILYVTSNPDVQSRIQKEIDAATSGSRRVVLSDREKMPFTEAVIMEVIRVACPITMTAFHTVTKDYYYRNYFIPRDTPIIGNLYAAFRNPEVFSNPEVFNPNRFLNEDGSISNREYWITFGMGPRKCLGEQLSKAEVFLFITSLFQVYNFSFPSNNPEPTLEPELRGIVRYPTPYKVLLKARC